MKRLFRVDRGVLRSDLLLLLTASIWGFAFVAQRAGMAHVGPFLFNGIRFALGAAVLAPLLAIRKRRGSYTGARLPLKEGILAGTVLFAGASLQQIGLVYTTAGNAGFVTGLYVILVPVIGIFLGQSAGWRTWAGSVLATAGMLLLSTAGSARMATGDLIVLAGAFFWASHIQIISRFMKEHRALPLAAVQFLLCSVLSLLSAVLFETVSPEGVSAAAVPLLYGGLVSVGIAYTLQVVAQKKAHPAHAAIIMSLETVFALLGGWLILGERVTVQGSAGGFLMLSAMMLSAAGQYGRRVPAGL
jgi:drug/metabolite transporter (DMT)-like permease